MVKGNDLIHPVDKLWTQELLQSLEESRKSAKEEAEKEIGQAKQAREEADAYAAEKRESQGGAIRARWAP